MTGDLLIDRLRAAVDPPPDTPLDAPADPSAPRDAAVLLLVDPTAPSLPMLFMRRTRIVTTHRGQIAFPGGGVDAADRTPVATALREAHEELAVPPDAVEVLGVLPASVTVNSGRRLFPVVGVETRPVEPVPDGYEVAEWFRVGVADLLAAPVTSRRIPGVPGLSVHFIEVGGRVIWGATAGIVVTLLERLRH